MRSTPSSARAQQLRGKGKWPGRAERIDDITRPKRQALEKSPEALRALQYIESRWKAIAVRIVLSSIFIYITHWRSSIARRWGSVHSRCLRLRRSSRPSFIYFVLWAGSLMAGLWYRGPSTFALAWEDVSGWVSECGSLNTWKRVLVVLTTVVRDLQLNQM